MNIAIVTSHSENNQSIFDLTTKNHAEYCRRHSYEYMPVVEDYHPHIDVDKARDLVENYDYVLYMGCDVWVQQLDTAIESFAKAGVCMCRELRQPNTLNGDMMLFSKSPDTTMVFDFLDAHQQEYPHTQAALNSVPGMITELPTLQVGCPAMNPSVDYRKIRLSDYFALHFYTMGKRADIQEKLRYLKHYAENHK